MEHLLKALRDMIPGITLLNPGDIDKKMPYVTYEYDSVTFENQYQILFSMIVTSGSAYEADTIASSIRQQLNKKKYSDVEVGFCVTQAPTIQVEPNQSQGIHSRRLTFTIIAYFKEV